MALATTRNKGAISTDGGGVLTAQEVTSAGADLGSPDSGHDLGYLETTTATDTTPITDRADETGDPVVSVEGTREVIVSGTLMQRDKATLDMAEEVRGKFYRLRKYMGIVDGQHQEIFYATGKITPQFNVTTDGSDSSGTNPFEYRATKAATTITIGTTALASLGAYTTGAVSIGAGKFYAIVNTTVS